LHAFLKKDNFLHKSIERKVCSVNDVSRC